MSQTPLGRAEQAQEQLSSSGLCPGGLEGDPVSVTAQGDTESASCTHPAQFDPRGDWKGVAGFLRNAGF